MSDQFTTIKTIRPITHVLFWRCEPSEYEFKITASCKRCSKLWIGYLPAFFKGEDLERYFERLIIDLEREHLREKEADIHLLDTLRSARLPWERELFYQCGKEASYPGREDLLRYGLDVQSDDRGEGFTVALEKATCEACVAAFAAGLPRIRGIK